MWGLLCVFVMVCAAGGTGWKELTPASALPMGRFVGTLVDTEGGAVLFGGVTYDGTSTLSLNDTWFYNASGNAWHELTNLGDVPASRGYHSATPYQVNSFLVFGGKGEPEFFYNGVYQCVVDTANLEATWSVLSPEGSTAAPVPRFWHSGAAGMQYDILVFGGYALGLNVQNDLWGFVASTGQWTQLIKNNTAGSPPARHGHSGTSTALGMLVFGGYQGLGGMNDLWTYDEKANQWLEVTTAGALPSPREAHTAVCTNNSLLVFGGSFIPYNPNQQVTYYDDVWLFHSSGAATGTWAMLSSEGAAGSPQPRDGHMAVARNVKTGSMMTFGGYVLYTGYENDLYTYH